MQQTLPLRKLTCHAGSHSVTCHPADVTFLPVSQPEIYSDPGGMQGTVGSASRPLNEWLLYHRRSPSFRTRRSQYDAAVALACQPVHDAADVTQAYDVSARNILTMHTYSPLATAHCTPNSRIRRICIHSVTGVSSMQQTLPIWELT